MPTMTGHSATEAWKLGLTPSAAGTKTYTLDTKDKYVDQNIEITETITAAELQSVAGNAPVATAGLADTTYLTTTSTGYAVTATADAAATSKTGVDAVKTAGWVPANGSVTVTTPAATQATTTKYIKAGELQDAAGGEVTATAGIAADSASYFTDSSDYPVVITADASSADSTTGVKTAGWIPTTATATVSGQTATQATTTKYLKKAIFSGGSSSASATGTGVALTASATQPTSGKYITVTGRGSIGVSTPGWATAGRNPTSDPATAYYTIAEATLNNSATNGKSYTEIDGASNSNVIIPSGGYLYINAGYIDNTKISLATLVPNGATITETATGKSDMMRGISAYDKDGKLIAGSMPDATLSASGSVTGITPAYNSTAGSYDVAITGSASAKTDSTGYATADTTTGTGDITSTATLAKTTLGVSVTGAGTVTPVISNKAQTVSGKTQITAAPVKATTGIDKYYMAVNTAAISKTAKATPTATAGYTDGTNHGGNTAVDVTAGAATSGTYYIPVASGAISASGSITDATATISDPAYQSSGTNAGKFTLDASGTVSGTISASTSTSGYVEKDITTGTGTLTDASISGTKVLDKIEVKATKEADGAVKPVISEKTASAGSGKVQVSATPTTSTSDVTKYYVAVNTAAITASTTVTPGVSKAGYGTTAQFASAGNVTVTRGASASDTTYIPLASGGHTIAANGAATVTKASVTASVSGTGAANAGATYYGSATPLSATKPASGAYIEIGGSAASSTAGSISIPIRCTATAGYVEAGTETFSAQGNVGVDVTDSGKQYIAVYNGSYTVS